jgi:pimeloyl-ACP methyl ester carboxylesterase
MIAFRFGAVFVAGLSFSIAAQMSAQTPRAVFTDPPHDARYPARSEVLHIPSGGVKINGLAYIAQGANPHPTVILLHGLPGNEKNLDLAQAIRRAGWNVVSFNYRGSWGSPGEFRFANVSQDAEAVLAFVRDTANARSLNIDPRRIVMGGHSMGGWGTALTAPHHPELLGAFLISAADMSRWHSVPRDKVVEHMAGDMESLAGVTAESMADDIIANGSGWMIGGSNTEGFARMPLLILTANDDLASSIEPLIRQMKALGNKRVTVIHRETDHSWNDSRIALESYVVNWLAKLK